MKRLFNKRTIKWNIFKYNLITMLALIASTAVIFNIAIKLYMENDTKKQLNNIALHAENTALHRGPDFFYHVEPKPGSEPLPAEPGAEIDKGIPVPLPKANANYSTIASKPGNDLFRFYFVLDRSLREPLSILNADYILFDKKNKVISYPEEDYFKPSNDIIIKIKKEVGKLGNISDEKYINFTLAGKGYVAIAKPVSKKNSFGLGWIIIFSSLEKLNQLQLGINFMLLAILVLSALIAAFFSSMAAKKISYPFSSLNMHLRSIAERNFSNKIDMSLDNELQEFVNNINVMSDKLESYDKAQKTFLQNVSHEFRTPLMSIQGYAEGIQFKIVDEASAASIILDETKRMTSLVEDLLYLSRLDTIQENYDFKTLSLSELICDCIERVNGLALTKDINIVHDKINKDKSTISINCDEEKISRAICNILNNCIRYASSSIKISLEAGENTAVIVISDDGPGFDSDELENIFERFYKGKNGKFGLGLAITKNIIEKHNGTVYARNSLNGAEFLITLPLDAGAHH